MVVTLRGIEVNQETDNFQKTTEEITEVGVGEDQDQKQILIDTELGVLDAEIVIILPSIVQI